MKSHTPLAYLFSNNYFKMDNYIVYILARSYIKDSLLSQVIFLPKHSKSIWVCWLIHPISAFGRMKQEDCHKFKAYYWVHTEFMAKSGLQNETLPI